MKKRFLFANRKKQPGSFLESNTEIKELTAMAPWRILHCKSPVLFANGGLYNTLHSGFTSSLSLKTERHGVSILLSSIFLLRIRTHIYTNPFLYKKKNQQIRIFFALLKYLNILQKKVGLSNRGKGLRYPACYSLKKNPPRSSSLHLWRPLSVWLKND